MKNLRPTLDRFRPAGRFRRPRGDFLGTAALFLALGLLRTAAAAPTLETLVEFRLGPTTPYAGLVLGGDGNFYGTSTQGGASGNGTVYRLTPAGAVTILVDFTSNGASNRGDRPATVLAQGADGNFYGTTFGGGAFGTFPNLNGTVFRLTPAGALTTLIDFTGASGANRGANPYAALVLGADGNFYGTTYRGGASDFGTAFRLTPGGVLTTLLDFTGTGVANRGAYPTAALLRGTDGNFYGTTYNGGASASGTLFRMTPSGSLTTPASSFTGNGGSNRGAYPAATLVRGTDGNFYGTTFSGGTLGNGTVFRLTPAGVLTTLVDFTGTAGANRGANPNAALLADADGNFYGTTESGGAANVGTIFRLTPAGALTTLVDFTVNGASNKGSFPRSALVFGLDGNFYGTTREGGAFFGTAFRLRIGSDGSRLVSVGLEPGTGTRVRWQAAAGQVSRVEYSDNQTGAWQSFAGTMTASGAGVSEYLDTTQPRPAKRFYRLVTPP